MILIEVEPKDVGNLDIHPEINSISKLKLFF